MEYTIVSNLVWHIPVHPDDSDYHCEMSNIHYKDSFERFIGEVNDKIKEGWEPLGGVTIVTAPHDHDGKLYMQAMIKK